MKPGKTRLVWVETPANPLWTITDIAATAQIAHAAGALLAVDSTVASPVLTRPIEHGADIVMHAGTKYLNGHSDLIAGVLVTARDDDFWKRVKTVRAQLGGTLGSFEAWLLLRGMRTLYLRVRCASASAQRIAEHFANHPRVEAVLYPGLPGAPGHAVAARQMTRRLRRHAVAAHERRQRRRRSRGHRHRCHVKLWKRATSLGGTESLIEHRASVEGAGTPAPPDLLRLSVGIEDCGDLIADLEQALHTALP